MKNELTELQKRLLLILEWYHNFCVENNLRYYLLGGTMLGAARHQGFIPWDDDIDVGMPRSDYETFLKLTNGKQYGNFVVEGIHTENTDFFYGYSKIYDTKSTLIENTRYKIKRGIFIDLFPLDGAGNSESESRSFFRAVLNKYRILLARTCAIRSDRKWYKNLAVHIARMIPNSIVDNKKLMYSIDDICKTKDFDTSIYIANLYGNWGEREIVEKAVMRTPAIYRFENLNVYGVADYDKYLTSLYGDWRKLPPKEKQVSHHDFLECNLEKSYLEE